jgi:hypothetical protein
LLALTGAIYLSPVWFEVIVLGHYGCFVVVWVVEPIVGQPRLRLEAFGTLILVIVYVGIVFCHRMIPTSGRKHGATS